MAKSGITMIPPPEWSAARVNEWLDEQNKDAGVKHDTGKPLAAILGDFPHALEAIVAVGTYGANKYTRRGWEIVPDAEQRYADAFWRHLLKSCYEDIDPESGLSHKWHAAWNLLAILELEARQAHGL